MPNMRLSPTEADDIAQYLMHRDEKKSSALALPAMPSKSDWGDLLSDKKSSASNDDESAAAALEAVTQTTGERLAGLALRVIKEKRCAACHEFTPPGEKKPLVALPTKNDFAAIATAAAANPTGGCMAAESAASSGKVPVFGVSLNRAAAVSFLKQRAGRPRHARARTSRRAHDPAVRLPRLPSPEFGRGTRAGRVGFAFGKPNAGRRRIGEPAAADRCC